MRLQIPQIIYLALTFIGLGEAMANHGKVKQKEVNVWIDFVATTVVLGLLYWGGFFS